MSNDADLDRFDQYDEQAERGGGGSHQDDDSPFQFSSEDFKSSRQLPPLIFDGVAFELRSNIDSSVLLGADGRTSMMDVFRAVMLEESFLDFQEWVEETSPPIPMLAEASERVAKAYRSGNRQARRRRSSRSRSRR